MRAGNFITLLLLFTAAIGQSQTSPAFKWNNKPVTPEALVPLFPSMADGTSADSVDLKAGSFAQPVYRDTDFYLRSEKEIWMRCNLDYNGFTFYHVMGFANGKFIVMAYLNGGGTLTQALVFFLQIKGVKLYKAGQFETPNTRDFDVTVKGNEVIYRGKHHQVPGR